MVKIAKEKKVIIAYTYQFKIRGTVFIPPGSRFSDFMGSIEKKKFIPVTNAAVTDIFGNNVCKTKFLELNKDEILFMFPESEMEKRKVR